MNRERKPRFAFTDVERRTLYVLGFLLVVGIVGKQLLRYTEPDQPVVIEGRPPVVAEVSGQDSRRTLPGGDASSSLAPSTSDTVPSKLHAIDSRGTDRDMLDNPDGSTPGSETGIRREVSTTLDPDQVRVRSGGPGADQSDETAGSSTRSERFNLNQATSAQLETIPGVGPVLAGRILEWRAEHGSFQRIEDLLLIEGIGDKRLATIKQYVYVQPRNIAESEGKPDGGNKAL